MENIEIVYSIRFNKGAFAGKIVEVEVMITDLEYGGLPGVLIEEGYLVSWCNNDEYDVLNRVVHTY